MAEYVIELYVSRRDGDALERAAAALRRAAGELTREGTRVRYVRGVLIPDDETCLLIVESGSAEAVRTAARRAGIAFDRVAEALTEADGER